MPHLAAIYRSPTYSPLQHADNDTAILDRTVTHFTDAGWTVTRLGEDAVVKDAPPEADLYLNMCQGRRASEALASLERRGAPIYNRPSAVLSCHRHRLVRILEGARLPSPATAIVGTDVEALEWLGRDTADLQGDRFWVKRGDVHAERPEDVVLVAREDLSGSIEAFGRRGITQVAVQEHVPGPVYKFYGVADGSLFHVYDAATKAPPGPELDRALLRHLALTAARALRLEVFGGDAVAPQPGTPVLIDFNDWPSFAPIREQAAAAIATMMLNLVSQGIAV